MYIRKMDTSRERSAGEAEIAYVEVAAVRSLAFAPDAEAGQIVSGQGIVMVTGTPYVCRGVPLPASTFFFDERARPIPEGPWRGEADKIAWRDQTTGLECIILRDPRRGHLGGYVGVPASHPLYGFDKGAVPTDVGIEVHGGIVYARKCQDGPSLKGRLREEARRICHVAVEVRPETSATDYRVEDRHQWWFGFACDHVADLVPRDARHSKRGAALGIAQVYRDDAYVHAEVVNLAAQLRAIADGRVPPARVGPPLPPASLDPRRAS